MIFNSFNISFIPKLLLKEIKNQLKDEVENNSTPCLSLPPEIILRILSFLELADLGRASLVCREWRYLLECPEIWKIKLLLFRLSTYSDESNEQRLKNWTIKCKLKSFLSIGYRETLNIEILAYCNQDCICVNSHGEIRRFSKWNLPRRLLKHIQDPFGHELDRVILKTFDRMIYQAEVKKELGAIWYYSKKKEEGQIILYATLMADLMNKGLIDIKYFDKVTLLVNTTSQIVFNPSLLRSQIY